MGSALCSLWNGAEESQEEEDILQRQVKALEEGHILRRKSLNTSDANQNNNIKKGGADFEQNEEERKFVIGTHELGDGTVARVDSPSLPSDMEESPYDEEDSEVEFDAQQEPSPLREYTEEELARIALEVNSPIEGFRLKKSQLKMKNDNDDDKVEIVKGGGDDVDVEESGPEDEDIVVSAAEIEHAELKPDDNAQYSLAKLSANNMAFALPSFAAEGLAAAGGGGGAAVHEGNNNNNNFDRDVSNESSNLLRS